VNFAQDLLAQAGLLARLDPRRPNQANVRRAASTAYYALFHLLTSDGAERLARGPARNAHRELIRRRYDHSVMASVSKHFVEARAKWITDVILPSNALKDVAGSLGDLQQERHAADYSLTVPFTRVRAQEAVGDAAHAFKQWLSIRRSPEADFYLLVMLLGPPRR